MKKILPKWVILLKLLILNTLSLSILIPKKEEKSNVRKSPEFRFLKYILGLRNAISTQ
jgi:hypothetical protein